MTKNFLFFLLISLVSGIGGARCQTLAKQGPSTILKLEGLVQDSKGDPIIGASVSLNGKAKVITDLNGVFQITCPEGSTLAVSFIGYQKKEIKITNQTFLKVTLYESTETLKDIVVVGYGTQKKATLVGAVQSVKAEDLRVTSSNLSTAFAGKLAGVIATQSSGEPGSDGASFWIRGVSTYGGTTTPLVIIDGVEGSSGDLNSLDPEIIENFSILADATATALYGTRGANGVIIVTTKSGQDREKPAINIRVEGYMNSPIKVPKLVDGATYMELDNEAIENRESGSVEYTQAQIDNTRNKTNKYYYPDVDWYKELFNNTAWNQDVSLNVRGGSQRADYFMNVSVHNENGMSKNLGKKYGYSWNTNENIKKYVFQNNLGVKITPTTHASLKLHVEMDDAHNPTTSTSTLFYDAMAIGPAEFPVYFPLSSLEPTSDYKDANQVLWGGKMRYNNESNPVALDAIGYNKTFQSTLIANFQVDQDLKFITKGLKASVIASFKNWSYTYTNHYVGYNQFDATDYDTSSGLVDVSLLGTESARSLSYSYNHSGDRTIYFEGLLNYERTFGDHDFSLMGVYNQREYDQGSPSSNDASLPYRTQGIAGRANYVYKGRYLSEFNFGYNGSENFAKGHRWGFFPSIGLGYIISEESWWKSSQIGNIITNLKFRGSWGKVGTADSDTRFMYLSSITLSSGHYYTTGTTADYSLSGPVYSRTGNSDITWETATKTNLGLDLQFFKKLNLTADFFYEKRRNIFMEKESISAELGTGSTSLYGNWGAVNNKGVDASLNYNTDIGKDWTVQVNGTFTFARNTVKAYPESPYTEYPQLSKVGHSINSVLGYVAQGLFKDDADVASSPTQSISGLTNRAGDIKYEDLPNKDGETDGEITTNDRKYIGHPTVPEIVYGFGASAKYKNLDFSVFFQGQGLVSLFMSGFHPFETIANCNYNVLKWVANNRWTTDNQNVNAKYPRLSDIANTNTTVTSTFWMRNASFLKLKNAEIGYTYKKLFRFYASGANLLTFSKFKIWDPAMGGGSGFAYPTQMTVSVGLQMSFNK
jgi:TonB-linked SusC/RagA family outer membrane protein